MTLIKSFIRDVPDFPKQGIVFKDITPVLADAGAFGATIGKLVRRYQEDPPDCVVAVESRGFILGAPLAHALGRGLVVVRKPGKLPADTIQETYELEYGSDTLEIHSDAIRKGQRCVVIDDLLATGGTAAATCRLVERLGGTVQELAFMIELAFLDGRNKLSWPLFSLLRY
ncbi:MAG: adenine phosphoribosyltransferase [Candidatus Marinimicrobia bacterium]|nr:adenine phosphoribosyltransferase [Candidatus Neomarinimicrobiota bacterium]